MGFREGSWLTVWSIEKNSSGKSTKIRASSSRKNKETDEYETDWSGFVTLAGDANKKAAMLKERDRIKIKGCDVTTRYVKEQNKEYTNYTVWDFEMSDFNAGGKKSAPKDDYDEESTPF